MTEINEMLHAIAAKKELIKHKHQMQEAERKQLNDHYSDLAKLENELSDAERAGQEIITVKIQRWNLPHVSKYLTSDPVTPKPNLPENRIDDGSIDFSPRQPSGFKAHCLVYDEVDNPPDIKIMLERMANFNSYEVLAKRLSAGATNSGQSWAESHKIYLLTWYKDGNRDLKYIAAALGRTPWACLCQLIKLETKIPEADAYAMFHSVFK